MNKLAAILIVGLIAVPAMAWPPNPAYLAGDFNGWTANGTLMTETSAGSGVWTSTLTGLAAGSRHEFKVTIGDWSQNYPGSGNSWFYADASGNVTVTYDSTNHADGWGPGADRIGISTDPGAWTAVGDWQGWSNGNPLTSMVAQGGGIYKFQTVLSPGTYQYKAVNTGTWDAIGVDSRSNNAATWQFTTDATNNTVTFWADASAGRIKVDITPEPATLALMLIGGLALIRRR
jgi:hypothetical protein